MSIVLYLGGLHCAVSSSPSSPINVIFSSVNLRNILQWSPGNGTPDYTHFTVQYTIYGDSVEGSKGKVNWREVRQCTRIARSWCDLSNETMDLEQGYYARVRAVSRKASSKWTVTPRRFDPKTDTSFGPPVVSVETEDNSAIITLKGPMRYQPDNHTPGVSMSTLYPTMTYNLSIHNTRRNQTSHFQVVSGPYKYRLMEYDTDYCFSAKARFLSMPVHCLSSVWQCITTPSDPVTGQLKSVVVSIVVPTVCMCMLVVVGYLLYQYLTGKGQKSPYILNPPSFHPPPLIIPPENCKFIFTIVKPSDIDISDPACPIQWPHNADPPRSYVPQRPETPEPEEPQDDLSIDYGFIGTAPKISVRREEERERRHNGGEDGSTLKLEECHCAGVYASHQSNVWQKSTHTYSQTHMPMHTETRAQTEMSTFVQAHAFSEVNLVPLTQTQAPLLATKGEVDRKREGTESEEVPLLSAYASQNIRDMYTFDTDQSNSLPDDYGLLRLAEQEEGPSCIKWDPNTGKLVLPEMSMEFNREGGLDGLMQGEKGRENRVGGEEEYAMRGKLRLENVIVRQTSEEASEAQTEMTRAVETGWEADDVMTKWNLVISMGQ